MSSKKDLKEEKELLNRGFKNVCKEWYAIKRKLVKGQREIQREETELNNPMYKTELKETSQSGEYKDRMLIYNPSVELIQEYQKNSISYGKICQKMHNLEWKIYRKREEIKNKPSHVKGSKISEQLNYKEGFALAALKSSYNKFYPKKKADVISIIKDLADTVNVKLHLLNEQEISQELDNLLPTVRREGEINKQNPNLEDKVGQARKNAKSMKNSLVQENPHQVR